VTSRRLILSVVLSISTLIVTLLAAEILLRFRDDPLDLTRIPAIARINPYRVNPFIVRARPYLYFHRPRAEYIQSNPGYEVTYRINSLGFRGTEISRTPPKGFRRLLVVGDSVVEGHGVEFKDTFATLLGRELHPQGWEVVNVGVQGASPLYYACNLDRYLNLHPDAILLLIFDNDLYEDRSRESQYFKLPDMDDSDALLSGEVRPSSSPFKLVTLVRRMMKRLEKARADSALDLMVRENLRGFRPNEEQKSLDTLSPYLVAPSLFDAEWRMSERYLDLIATRLQESSVRLFVANLSLTNLDTQKPPAYRSHALRLEAGVQDWTSSRKIPFLDLIPAVDGPINGNPKSALTIPLDGHPSAEGHAFMARELLPWLRHELATESALRSECDCPRRLAAFSAN